MCRASLHSGHQHHSKPPTHLWAGNSSCNVWIWIKEMTKSFTFYDRGGWFDIWQAVQSCNLLRSQPAHLTGLRFHEIKGKFGGCFNILITENFVRETDRGAVSLSHDYWKTLRHKSLGIQSCWVRMIPCVISYQVTRPQEWNDIFYLWMDEKSMIVDNWMIFCIWSDLFCVSITSTLCL